MSPTWDNTLMRNMSEEILAKVDKKGRVLLPSKVRRDLKIKSLVRMRVGIDNISLTPVANPTVSVTKYVVRGTKDVEKEIRRLRRRTEKQILKEAAKIGTG